MSCPADTIRMLLIKGVDVTIVLGLLIAKIAQRTHKPRPCLILVSLCAGDKAADNVSLAGSLPDQ